MYFIKKNSIYEKYKIKKRIFYLYNINIINLNKLRCIF